MKNISSCQARLIAKFDHASQLPQVFNKYDVSIQPTSRGTYAIGHFESYFSKLPEAPTPQAIGNVSLYQSLDPKKLTSESAALLYACHNQMLSELLGEEMAFTVFGRMGSGQFEYSINNCLTAQPYQLQVENAQCEVDGGFEGDTQFCIVESKNATVTDFLIRQLYYPYRLWRTKMTKPVVPVFLTYSNDVFLLRAFRFTDDGSYNSLELVNQKSYSLVPLHIELDDVIAAWKQTQIAPEPPVTFPQADSFARVLDLLQRMAQEPLKRDDVSLYYDIAPRQVNYYTDATMYLDLAEKHRDEDGINYQLTNLGRRIMKLDARSRNLEIIKRIFQHEVFHKTFAFHEQLSTPTTQQIADIMRQSNLVGLDPQRSTIERRASTVSGWIRWMLELTRL